jgi:hypothetical protein
MADSMTEVASRKKIAVFVNTNGMTQKDGQRAVKHISEQMHAIFGVHVLAVGLPMEHRDVYLFDLTPALAEDKAAEIPSLIDIEQASLREWLSPVRPVAISVPA